MSKASNYAELCAKKDSVLQFRWAPRSAILAQTCAHEKTMTGEEWFGAVCTDGCLSLRGVLPPDQAIHFAKWIKDTYGEP